MKINFVLPGTGIAGGIRVVFEYANRLSQRGHDVKVIYPVVPPRMDRRWTDYKARITQFLGSVKRLIRGNSVDWFDVEVKLVPIPTIAPDAISLVRHFIPDADIIVATSWETAYLVAALGESKGTKVYFVQHYEIWKTWNDKHSWEKVDKLASESHLHPIEMKEVTPTTEDTRREKELVDKSYSLPLSKITISTWLLELLENKFDEEVVGVVPNSIDHDTFYYDPDQQPTSDSRTILLPFRNATWKGKNEIEEITEYLHREYDVNIHLYGPSDAGNTLPGYVEYYNRPTDDELRKLYSNADIFVYPSWVEGFGLPPLEAMATKCAVVTTNTGRIKDFPADTVASIVPPRDTSALIDSTCELIDDDAKKERLQRSGYEHVQQYSYEDATDKLENILMEL